MTDLVRRAHNQDVQAIAAIGRESFTWAFGHLYREEVLARYLEATYGEEKLASSLAKEANVYFVAEQDGRVAGFLKLKAGSPRSGAAGVQWQTQKLYVQPGLVHGGVGRSLMAAGVALMKERGVASTWLAVYTGNERAKGFYRALGFRDVGSQTLDFEGMTVAFILMEKDLKG